MNRLQQESANEVGIFQPQGESEQDGLPRKKVPIGTC